MILELPVSQKSPRFFFDIDLEGETYRLEFDFNDRAAKWFMNIRDTNGDALVQGLCIVLGSDILAPYHHRSIPPGGMFAYDTSGKDLDPDVNDLGERVQLIYVEST